MKITSEIFSSKVSSEDIGMIKKIIGKLISHNQESIKELPELFNHLDGGYKLDIKDLTDMYV